MCGKIINFNDFFKKLSAPFMYSLSFLCDTLHKEQRKYVQERKIFFKFQTIFKNDSFKVKINAENSPKIM